MGIITKASDFISENPPLIADKAGDCLTSFSQQQVLDINKRRKQYLESAPDMQSENSLLSVQKKLGSVAIEVYQAYLDQLKTVYDPTSISFDSFDEDNRIRFFDLTRWIIDTDEQSIDKLVNVYHVLSGENCNIALIYHRTKEKCRITIGIANTDETNADPSVADNYCSRVIGAIRGNFPGAEIVGMGMSNPDYGIGIPECLQSIAETTDTGKVKSVVAVSNVPSEKSEAFISQSMEKLLDGIIPETDEDEYTIVLLAKPLQDMLEEKNRLFELYTSLSPYANWQISNQQTESEMDGNASTVGANASVGISYIATANFGVSFSRSANKMIQVGKNEGVTQTHTNYGVKHTLEIIESQIKRIEESSALGMWEFASYIISDNPVVANNVAHMYLALTQGEKSYITRSAINFWDGDIETKHAETILNSIQKLQHPLFSLKTNLEDDWLMYPPLVNATTAISGKELARALNFPRKSVSGFPVFECAHFGRNISSYKGESISPLKLGHINHMRHSENAEVILDRNSLTSHVFITGSTGTGKSNTVFQIIRKANVPFLVIEPAKGEYKTVFGGNSDVRVLGTNPKLTEVLRINPFSFPDNIAVSEHIDRLVELFNVCWPMYAAMPAILKDAVIRSYEEAGWDITRSINKYNEALFPTFSDVLDQIRYILNNSDYSAENKSDYTGALVTRIRSLTNGINGVIFSADSICDEDLFDNKVIVDLSRIGSTETRALIMSVLIMKLQEFRLSNGLPNNSNLSHLTVLEEAHNILKRTSTEQTNEGANLLGKSVEMLTNSIAELRSFGEGFIIADQAPGLLDMAVIRNTNTKIIHRLPDQADRELVGMAAGLDTDQIKELAKLELGVAAVYQNDWIEPVLCKVEKLQEYEKKTYVYSNDTTIYDESAKARKMVRDVLLKPNEYVKVDLAIILHSDLPARIKAMMLEMSKGKHIEESERAKAFFMLYPNIRLNLQKSENGEYLKNLQSNIQEVCGSLDPIELKVASVYILAVSRGFERINNEEFSTIRKELIAHG